MGYLKRDGMGILNILETHFGKGKDKNNLQTSLNLSLRKTNLTKL